MAESNRVATEHQFDADTRVQPTSDGHFEAALSDRWNALGGTVNGGYSVAVCLQALRAVLPHPDPLAVSAFFLRPGAPGPVEVHTDIARRGRRMSTAEACIYQDGRELVRTTATFADLDHDMGPTTVLADKPELPAPDEAVDPIGETGMPGVSIADQLEYRFAALPGWSQGRPSGEPHAEFWMRFKSGRDPDTLSLPMLVDGAAPMVLELGAAGSSTLQLTTHVRGRPAPGWLACRVHTRYVIGGYHEEDFEVWDSEGTLVAQARQLALALPG